MDQLTELCVDRTQPIPFTHQGRKLKARPMPLGLALSINEPSEDGTVEVTTDTMVECISQCVLFADDGKQVYTAEQIRDADHDLMVPLFKAVTEAFNAEDAKKN